MIPSCSKTRNPFTGEEANAVGVKVDDLSKNYGTATVLKNVSFDVEPGEIFVLMGPSGSGKSVLLRHIAGLERPDLGHGHRRRQRPRARGDPRARAHRPRLPGRAPSSTRSASTTTWPSTRASTAPATRRRSTRRSCTR